MIDQIGETVKNILLLLVIILFTATFTISAQTSRSDVANPENFHKIESDMNVPNCRGSLKSCGEKALVALDLAGFGGPDHIKYKTETFTFENGVGIYLLTITGLKEPFTSGERIRIAFQKSGKNYNFAQARKQYQCSRGADSGKWKKVCEPDGSVFPSGNRKFGDKNATPRSEIENADDFRSITVHGRAAVGLIKLCFESLEKCGRAKLNFYNVVAECEPDSELCREETFAFADKTTGKNRGIYLLTMHGFEDDSVSSIRVRIEFQRKDNAWQTVIGGKQFQCARGEKAGRWTKELCP